MSYDSALTRFQETAATRAVVDLSFGYPRLAAPSRRWHQFSQLLRSDTSPPSTQYEEIAHLVAALRSFLPVSDQQPILVTHSGSIALARTLAALTDGRRYLITAPGFDAIYSLAAETTQREPAVVTNDPFSSHQATVNAVLDAITPEVGVVVLVSPDNPSGVTLSRSDLQRLAVRCAEVDAVLVVDQCFALVTPYGGGVELASSLGDLCRWCVVWDTSKVVELGGERLGFILPHPSVQRQIERALRVVQFELALPTLRVMTAYFRELLIGDLENINTAVRANYTELRKAAEHLGLGVNEPEAGSFALISLAGTRYERRAGEVAGELLQKGLAVMPSSFLMPAENSVPGFLRLGLAQRRQTLDRAVAILVSHLEGEAVAPQRPTLL